MKCENCGNEHDGSYGSGRFCSAHCRRVWSGKKSSQTAVKRGTKHCGFNDHKENRKRKPYGTWKCRYCSEVFLTRKSLVDHMQKFHKHNYECIHCGQKFDKPCQLGNHVIHCKKNPKYQEIKNTISSKISAAFIGKPLSEEHKRKTSEGMIKYRRSLTYATYSGFVPSYNLKSIHILESIAKDHGWNIQHAENKGEFYVLGYFVDAYDKNKNVVIEYDEPHHYEDIEHNVLCEADLKRQKEIIEYLHCEFWRYNEKMKCLWKV